MVATDTQQVSWNPPASSVGVDSSIGGAMKGWRRDGERGRDGKFGLKE